jgi:hypothetical protein
VGAGKGSLVKKATLILAMHTSTEPTTTYRSVDGYSDGRMGIYKNRTRWAVIHVPSGYTIHPGLRSSDDAKSLVQEIGPLLPADGVLGESPALRMTEERRGALRETFKRWLDERGYKHRGLVEMVGEPVAAQE